jgi:hypothetical protein
MGEIADPVILNPIATKNPIRRRFFVTHCLFSRARYFLLYLSEKYRSIMRMGFVTVLKTSGL